MALATAARAQVSPGIKQLGAAYHQTAVDLHHTSTIAYFDPELPLNYLTYEDLGRLGRALHAHARPATVTVHLLADFLIESPFARRVMINAVHDYEADDSLRASMHRAPEAALSELVRFARTLAAPGLSETACLDGLEVLGSILTRADGLPLARVLAALAPLLNHSSNEVCELAKAAFDCGSVWLSAAHRKELTARLFEHLERAREAIDVASEETARSLSREAWGIVTAFARLRTWGIFTPQESEAVYDAFIQNSKTRPIWLALFLPACRPIFTGTDVSTEVDVRSVIKDQLLTSRSNGIGHNVHLGWKQVPIGRDAFGRTVYSMAEEVWPLRAEPGRPLPGQYLIAVAMGALRGSELCDLVRFTLDHVPHDIRHLGTATAAMAAGRVTFRDGPLTTISQRSQAERITDVLTCLWWLMQNSRRDLREAGARGLRALCEADESTLSPLDGVVSRRTNQPSAHPTFSPAGRAAMQDALQQRIAAHRKQYGARVAFFMELRRSERIKSLKERALAQSALQATSSDSAAK